MKRSNITCVTLLIDGPNDTDPWGREALYFKDRKIGRLTSAAFGHFNKSIGLGYVEKKYANTGERLKVKILNDYWDCEVVDDSPYDSKNEKIRMDG